jgi:predicted transcriptional regulator
MAKSLTEMAAEIAAAQASHASMTADELEEFLNKTFQSLKRIKTVEEGGEPVEPVTEPEEADLEQLDPKKSIQRNKIICLECGKEFKQISQTHLKGHGLTARDYRKKYGLPARQALSAKSLSAQRRKRALELGLGDRLKKGRKAKNKKK